MTISSVFGSEVGILSGVETTIVTFINTTGVTQFLRQSNIEANGTGCFNVYLNNVLSLQRRVTSSKPSYILKLYDLTISNGDIVSIKFIHSETFSKDASSSLTYSDQREEITEVFTVERKLKGVIQGDLLFSGIISGNLSLKGSINNAKDLMGIISGDQSLNGQISNIIGLKGQIQCS